MIEPYWTHDCSNCEIIGVVGNFDLYVCKSGDEVITYVVRWGEGGPDYTSGQASEWTNDMEFKLMGDPLSMMLKVAEDAHNAIIGYEINQTASSGNGSPQVDMPGGRL